MDAEEFMPGPGPMGWESFVESLSGTVDVNMWYVAAFTYVVGMFTWGLKDTREYTKGFYRSHDNFSRVLDLCGAFFCWLSSPTWVMFRCTLFPLFRLAEKGLGVRND